MSWPNQFNVYDRIESVKRLLEPIVPDGNSFKVRGVVMRCMKYRKHLIDTLTKDEARAYDLLLANKLNPQTVYSWLLLEHLPPHLRQQLEQQKISIEKARTEFVKWNRMEGTASAEQLMRDIREVVGRLKWKSQENTSVLY